MMIFSLGRHKSLDNIWINFIFQVENLLVPPTDFSGKLCFCKITPLYASGMLHVSVMTILPRMSFETVGVINDAPATEGRIYKVRKKTYWRTDA